MRTEEKEEEKFLFFLKTWSALLSFFWLTFFPFLASSGSQPCSDFASPLGFLKVDIA